MTAVISPVVSLVRHRPADTPGYLNSNAGDTSGEVDRTRDHYVRFRCPPGLINALRGNPNPRSWRASPESLQDGGGTWVLAS